MIKHKLCLSGLLLVLVSPSLHAQTGLRLSEIWDMTLSDYPGIDLKKAQLEESRIVKKLTRNNNYFPSVQLQLQNSMGSYQSSSGSFFPLPGVINTNGRASTVAGQPSAAFNTFGSVVADWKFFEFGRKTLVMKAADQGIERATSDLDAQQLKLRTRSTRLYLNILNSKINLLWALENAARTKQIFELSASLSAAGLKPGADSSLALSSYLQTLSAQELWTAKLGSDLTDLKALALKADTAQGLAYGPYLNAATIRDDQVQIIMNHPYLQVLESTIEYGQTQAALAGRRAFPTVSAIGGLALRGSGIGPDGLVDNRLAAGYNNGSANYLVGIAVTFNITDAFNSGLENKRITQRVRADQANYAMQKLDLETNLSSVTKRIAGQKKQITNVTAAVKNARLAYDLYMSRYESGLISLTELLQIQSILQQAEKTNIDAHQQLWEQILVESEATGDFSYLQNQFN
ncbi:TolC family protein [Dyadobacter frigoris]|uniref:TolC family protein n=1 Tax=Dyadobacter frigoris TaxID=2576211 RepID=A0A4U6D4K7_9BACT|nr:TolC family protein [Dyadobacter frigoris]TKT92192.1 TolC family protein [Dyadobacter frigoris]